MLLAALVLPLSSQDAAPGLVRCANLVYASGKTSVCFADHFLSDLKKESNVWTEGKFTKVNLENAELFKFPFSVMTGEGAFTLTAEQRRNLREYLIGGGFLLASAGCSSEPWDSSFRREIAAVFPEAPLEILPMDHPVFKTIYEIKELKTKKIGSAPRLEGLIWQGRIVMVYSKDGLNDTANAGGKCCCCGGNELLNARQVNVNLLAYALTH